MDRDNNGRFAKGNKIRQKPILCPYCNKEIKVDVYVYLKKESENQPK